MLDSTVLRSGLMDGFCVVLFEVGVFFLFGEFGSPPMLGENLEGHSSRVGFEGSYSSAVYPNCRR